MKTKLLCAIAVVWLAALPSPAAEEAPARVSFRAELVKVGALTPSTGGWVIVHAHPFFFARIRLAEKPAAPLEWKQGETVLLGIHSVEELFGGAPTEGAVYTFSVGVVRKGGRLHYADLKVVSGPPGK